MNQRVPGFSVVLTLVGLAYISAPASLIAGDHDWPQWRGPDRTGLSMESGLLESWPENGPKLVWIHRDGGLGYSSNAVVDDRLYTMGLRGDAEFVIALDVKDGHEVWSTEIGPLFTNGWGNGPRSTPTIHEGRVYALGAAGDIVCLQADDGKLVWRRTMADFGGSTPDWGYVESPLVEATRVMLTPGGPNGAVVALNRDTGELLWQSKQFIDGAQYSSIIAVENHGVSQYVQRTMESVVGLSLNGTVLWHVEYAGRTAMIPTPIYRDGRVYVAAGYGVGCMMTEIDKDQKASQVYANKVMKNHHGGVVLVGDHLYGYSDGYGWTCQAFDSGELVWNEKEALGKGSVCYADGRLYCLTESGDVALLEATPKGYVEHGRFRLDPQTQQRHPRGAIWSHPVVANGKLYLRDQDLILCYDIKD
jgi:outer membrane protein assembly factor BamB